MGARLTGMTRVNLRDLYTVCLPFILNKMKELGKTPTMQATFCLFLFNLGGVTNVRQILKDKGASWLRVLNTAFREDMVMVFALPKQFPRQAFQMTLCRFRAFGLQLSS